MNNYYSHLADVESASRIDVFSGTERVGWLQSCSKPDEFELPAVNLTLILAVVLNRIPNSIR